VSDAPEAADHRPFDAPEAPTLRCPSCGAPTSLDAAACSHCGSLLSTRRCAACLTLNPRSAERCLRCGALLPSERLGPPGGGPCPDCRLPLVTRTTGVLGYGECPRCGGLFLTESAFGAVTHDADLRARVRVFEGALRSTAESLAPRFHYRSCPVCRTLMNRTNYAGGSGIIVDVCGYHGVWFDRGELTAIVDFFEKGGWDRVKKRDRERLNEEVRDLQNRKSSASDFGSTLGPALDAPASGFDLVELLSWLASLVLRR